MGLVESFIEAAFAFFKQLATAIVEVIGTTVIDPFLSVITYTPRPMRHGQPALFRTPTNGVWPTIHEAYLANLGASIAILVALYMLMGLGQSMGVVSAYRRQDTRNDALTALILLPFGWPAGALVLHFFAALTSYIMPSGTDLVGVFTTLLGGLAAGVAAPGVAVLSGTLGLVDLLVFLIALLLYLFRVVYLLVVMYGMPFLLVFAIVEIPVLGGVARTLLSTFLKLSFVPVIVAIGFDLTALLFTSTGEFSLGTGIEFGGVTKAVLALVLPLITIAAFYLVLRASFGAAVGQSVQAMQRRHGQSTVAGLAGGQVGERLDDLEAAAGGGVRRAPRAIARSAASHASSGLGTAARSIGSDGRRIDGYSAGPDGDTEANEGQQADVTVPSGADEWTVVSHDPSGGDGSETATEAGTGSADMSPDDLSSRRADLRDEYDDEDDPLDEYDADDFM